MKISTSAIILLLAPIVVMALELGFYPGIKTETKPGFDEVYGITEKADRVIWLNCEKKYDLGLGRFTEGARHPIDLEFAEIQHFLTQERHKDLIVIWFDKSIMWGEKDVVATISREVIKQMQSLGYKRVVVLGAHGSGLHYLADTAPETKEAEAGSSSSDKPAN